LIFGLWYYMRTDSNEGLCQEAIEAYLSRLDVDPASVGAPTRSLLARLQHAHLTTVPFETLAITGDPYGEREGAGVILAGAHLYEKIVAQRRGGYCFELNGLFHTLLDALGYTVYRAAARMASAPRIPANHHTNIVTLDRRYVVDVGTGPPAVRVPVPLDGSPKTDGVGVEWRAVSSERPDATHRLEYRTPEDTEWTGRYVFGDTPRCLRYFEATNDYLQSAPESPFTGTPSVTIATETGFRKLTGDTFVEADGPEEHERTVTGDAWHAVLEEAFGLQYRSEGGG
jgi:N-hydroxyarylamine O-acetyltransferase